MSAVPEGPESFKHELQEIVRGVPDLEVSMEAILGRLETLGQNEDERSLVIDGLRVHIKQRAEQLFFDTAKTIVAEAPMMEDVANRLNELYEVKRVAPSSFLRDREQTDNPADFDRQYIERVTGKKAGQYQSANEPDPAIRGEKRSKQDFEAGKARGGAEGNVVNRCVAVLFDEELDELIFLVTEKERELLETQRGQDSHEVADNGKTA